MFAEDDLPNASVRDVREAVGGPLRSDREYVGFDNNAGHHYVYPSGTEKFPFREYQHKICMEIFFQNTLNVLPAGMGKSFIASVVMYNIYRWYPMSKVIFLSASKSILKAQMEACSNIMNIPKGDCVEITGKGPARLDPWRRYRVIFATPRQLLADFKEVPDIPFHQIKLLVLTDAHKARGNGNPFAQIMQTLHQHNEYFRILAQTDVVSRKVVEIAEIIRNLNISHVEVRQENSPDIAAYVTKSSIKPLEVETPESYRAIREDFLIAIDPFLRSLLTSVNVSGSLSRMRLVTTKKKFIEANMTQKASNYAETLSTFDICIELYQALDLLNDYGVLSFVDHLDSLRETQRGDLKEFLEKLKGTFARCLMIGEKETFEVDEELHENIIAGHPKIRALEKVVMEHFQKNVESRLIIFSNCPKTSSLIHQCLRQKCSQMRCVMALRPYEMSESERNCTRLKFIRGTINTMITSSIPDEGVVNEVDLIICYDTNGRHLKQFIRGRVSSCGGRKCEILVAVQEGADTLAHSELWRERVDVVQDFNGHPIIMEALADQTPRLVPVDFNPVNLTPSLAPRAEKTRSAARNITDYFKNVPQSNTADPQGSGNLPITDENENSVQDVMSSDSVVPDLITFPLRMIMERVECVRREKYLNLAQNDENLEGILRRSRLALDTQEFLRDLLRRPKVCDEKVGFFEFLEKNVMTAKSDCQQNYFASIVGNVKKKLNDSWVDVRSDEMSQCEDTLIDISHLNTGFIDAPETALKSICGETILSFYLISSLGELFESDSPCDVLERAKNETHGEDVSDEEVIPSSQEIPLTRQRRKTKRDTPSCIDLDAKLSSISTTDSDNKVNLGTIEDIFGGNGSIFELDVLRADTPAAQDAMEVTSPSVLSGKRVNRLKHSSDNANDLPRETNSTCSEFLPTKHDGSSDDEVFGTYASNTGASKSRDAPRRRKPKSHRFIHFEADASDDDEEEDFSRLLDSIVVSDDEEQVDQLNRVNDIEAKYLQSVRSPRGGGGFRIPHPDRYRHVQDIYSQAPEPEPSEYIHDSFVVEEADESGSDLSVLGQAEEMLRARKRLKGGRGRGSKAKKSRILILSDSSDDDLHELRRDAGVSP